MVAGAAMVRARKEASMMVELVGCVPISDAVLRLWMVPGPARP